MPLVYSYLRFSDPRQAAGSSADRQTEYAQRWAAARGLVRASFARIVIWHSGEKPVDQADGAGRVIEMELQARGGGAARIRVDAAAGVLLD